MPGSPFFVQRCPSCGRQARIDVNYMGLQVVCQHCDNAFVAHDSTPQPEVRDAIDQWIRIADHVLDEPLGLADRAQSAHLNQKYR